jgi:hypothetical protein
MNIRNQLRKENVGLVGAICTSLLVGLPTIPLRVVAAPLSKVNPCSGIYYEEPFNHTRLVPLGCPPNAATQRSSVPILTPRPILPSNNVVVPLPETRSNAIATIMPMNGTVDVKLKNNTNAIVSYQALGSTERRFLSGGQEVILQNLPTPVTITMVRQDKGLLKVIPLSTSQQGMLEVSLDEAKNLDDNLGALRIQRDGQVFLN